MAFDQPVNGMETAVEPAALPLPEVDQRNWTGRQVRVLLLSQGQRMLSGRSGKRREDEGSTDTLTFDTDAGARPLLVLRESQIVWVSYPDAHSHLVDLEGTRVNLNFDL